MMHFCFIIKPTALVLMWCTFHTVLATQDPRPIIAAEPIVGRDPFPIIDAASTANNKNKVAFDFQTFLSSQVAGSKAGKQPKSWPSSAALQSSMTSIRWRDVIERLLEVRCLAERMSIVLHYEKTYSRLPPTVIDVLQKGRLYTEAAGPNSPSCSTSSTGMVKEEGALLLNFDYDDCGVEMGRGSNDTIVYSISVLVEATINLTVVRSADQFGSNQQGDSQQESPIREIKEQYRFRCVHPSRQRGLEEKASFSLLLSEEKYPRSYWTYPHTLDLGGLVYLYSEPALPWYSDAGLYSFPVNCWTSPYQTSSALNASSKGRRRMFVKDGCPVNNSRGRGLSYIHHFKDGPTKVSVHLGQYLLFGGGYEDDGQPESSTVTVDQRPKNVVMLTCEVVPCVQSFTFGLLNVPKCPVSYFCAGIPQLSHVLPVQLRSVQRIAVSAGPLVLRDKTEQNAARSSAQANISCQTMCRRVVNARQSLSDKQQRVSSSSSIFVEGVRTQVVIVVALVSFAFGLFVMGVLWWIHIRTDPTKRKRFVSNGNDDSLAVNPPVGAVTRFTADPLDQPRQSWHLNRFKHRDNVTTDSSSGRFDSPSAVHVASGQAPNCSLLHPFRIQAERENANGMGAAAAVASSASPTRALLKRCANDGGETGGSIANVDASTARKLLNTLR